MHICLMVLFVYLWYGLWLTSMFLLQQNLVVLAVSHYGQPVHSKKWNTKSDLKYLLYDSVTETRRLLILVVYKTAHLLPIRASVLFHARLHTFLSFLESSIKSSMLLYVPSFIAKLIHNHADIYVSCHYA